MVALGAAVLFELQPPLWVAGSMVSFFAIFHGHAHGTELPPGQSGLLYSMGFVCGTGLLHGFGISVGLVHTWTWGKAFLRVAGAFTMSMGVYFIVRALS